MGPGNDSGTTNNTCDKGILGKGETTSRIGRLSLAWPAPVSMPPWQLGQMRCSRGRRCFFQPSKGAGAPLRQLLPPAALPHAR